MGSRLGASVVLAEMKVPPVFGRGWATAARAATAAPAVAPAVTWRNCRRLIPGRRTSDMGSLLLPGRAADRSASLARLAHGVRPCNLDTLAAPAPSPDCQDCRV